MVFFWAMRPSAPKRARVVYLWERPTEEVEQAVY